MNSRELCDEIVNLALKRSPEWIFFGNHHMLPNEITEDDLALLAEQISKHQPTSLGLANLGLTDAQTIFLANALLTNNSIKTLYLPFNLIGDAGAIAISKLLLKKDCSITKLILFSNKINSKGARSLANALIANDTLIELELFNNTFTSDVVDNFKVALRDNIELEKLILFAPLGNEQLPEDLLNKLANNQLLHLRTKKQMQHTSLFAQSNQKESLDLLGREKSTNSFN